MTNLVHNERVKYTATFVNTIAIGCIIVGVLTPLQRIFDGEGHIPPVTLIAAGCWLVSGAILHWAVRRFLGRLRE
jgi:hypothetical protein